MSVRRGTRAVPASGRSSPQPINLGGLARLPHLARLSGLCAGLAVSACQAPSITGPVDLASPAPIEGAPLASDELSRLGRQDLNAGNSGLAEQHFRAAVDKNHDDSAAWIGLAAAYDNMKRFDLADRAYTQAIRLNGETPTIINNLGYSYFLRGDRVRALAQLQRAALLEPNNAVVQNNIRLVQAGEQPNQRAAP